MTEQLDPRLLVSMGVAGALEILIPLLLVIWLRRRLGTKWVVFGLGALAFGLSQILTRIPLVIGSQAALKEWLQREPMNALIFGAILAISAGLFEETARYLCYSKALRQESDWKNAVSLGAGHGGLESALLVGGLTFASLFGAIVVFNLDPTKVNATPEQLQKAKEVFLNMDWWMPALAVWERVCAIGMHISLSVIVLQRFVRGRMGWFWLAIAYHSAVNAAAIFTVKYFGAVAAEVLMTFVLALSLWIVFRLRPPKELPTVAQPVPG